MIGEAACCWRLGVVTLPNTFPIDVSFWLKVSLGGCLDATEVAIRGLAGLANIGGISLN